MWYSFPNKCVSGFNHVQVVEVKMNDAAQFDCKGDGKPECNICKAWLGKGVDEVSIYNKWGALFPDRTAAEEGVEWLQALEFNQLVPDKTDLEEWQNKLGKYFDGNDEEKELKLEGKTLSFVMGTLWKKRQLENKDQETKQSAATACKHYELLMHFDGKFL